MPRMGSFGSASWSAFRAKNSAAVFIFASGQTSVAGGVTVPWTGCNAGDMGLIVVGYGVASTPAGWTKIGDSSWSGYGYDWKAFSKVLSAGDVASGTSVTCASASGIVLNGAWRGASNVVAIGGLTGAQSTASSSVNVLTGFTKNANSRLVVCFCSDRDNGNTDTAPVNWSKRIANASYGIFFTGTVFDIIPNKYVSGSTVNIANSPGTLGTMCQLFELQA